MLTFPLWGLRVELLLSFYWTWDFFRSRWCSLCFFSNAWLDQMDYMLRTSRVVSCEENVFKTTVRSQRVALVLHNLDHLFLVLLQHALVSWFRKFKSSWIHWHLSLKVENYSSNIQWMFRLSFFNNTEMALWTRLCPKCHRCLSL